jgi:hypothetical protein
MYGVDGVFFWHHLTTLAPEGIREEFKESYTLAESLLLASFAGILVAVCHLGVVAAMLLGTYYAVAPAPLSPAMAVVLFLVGLAAAILFYRVALPAHREAGRVFRALVDLAVPQLQNCLEKATPAINADLKKKSEEMSAYLGAGRSSVALQSKHREKRNRPTLVETVKKTARALGIFVLRRREP